MTKLSKKEVLKQKEDMLFKVYAIYENIEINQPLFKAVVAEINEDIHQYFLKEGSICELRAFNHGLMCARYEKLTELKGVM
jgi:hypothetical protein